MFVDDPCFLDIDAFQYLVDIVTETGYLIIVFTKETVINLIDISIDDKVPNELLPAHRICKFHLAFQHIEFVITEPYFYLVLPITF